MFWEGNLNNLQLINCFWKIWAALKRAYGGQRPTRTGWLLRKLLLLRRCCGGDSVELLLRLLRLLNDLCRSGSWFSIQIGIKLEAP